MRIGIIVPSNDMLHADFAFCLARLIASTHTVQVGLINPRSSLVQKARWQGVRAAMNQMCDKVLFIDSDQTFPPDALLRLLRHKKSIVGAASLTRREPIEYTARDHNGDRIDFSQRTGLHQVHSNGFPLCLIDMRVFQELNEDDWFKVTLSEGHWYSEDESFCHLARAHGKKIWVDADLTKEVGHLGVKEFI